MGGVYSYPSTWLDFQNVIKDTLVMYHVWSDRVNEIPLGIRQELYYTNKNNV